MKKTKTNSQNPRKEFSLEEKIIHQLILNSASIKENGLFYGKMGLIISFIHYFKQSKNRIFEDLADELFEEIADEIHQGLPIEFGVGITGIGWGIEYLIQKGFVQGESLDICEEIDDTIMVKDPKRLKDYSIETGIGGILHYVLLHIKGVYNQAGTIPFDKEYLHAMFQATDHIQTQKDIPNETISLANQFTHFYKTGQIPDYTLNIFQFIDNVEIDENAIYSASLSLKNGLGGILLNLINVSK